MCTALPASLTMAPTRIKQRFFTETLKFFFSAVDLIEAGWNIAEWIEEGTTMSHPFGRFRGVYVERLTALKALLL